MRVSTSQLNSAAVSSMLDQQAKVSKTQIQLASGKRLTSPSDDPVAAARILDLKQSISVTNQYQKNTDAAEVRLELEEGILQGVTSTLQRVRELTVKAGNTVLTDNDRRTIAVELRQNLDELLAQANSKDNNNDFLFSGYQGSTKPFTYDGATNTFNYAGDEGQRQVQIGPTRQIADGDSGTDVFRSIRNGNGTFVINAGANTGSAVIDSGTVTGAFVPDTYTVSFAEPTPGNFTYTVTDSAAAVVAGPVAYQDNADIVLGAIGVQTSISGTPAAGDTFTISPSANQDIFQTVQNIVDALEAPVSNNTDLANLRNNLDRNFSALDQGLENILDTRAKVGSRLNNIDSQKNNNADFLLQAQTALSALEDVDLAEAAARLNLQMVGLQAAQQTYVRVQGLSLFNFL